MLLSCSVIDSSVYLEREFAEMIVVSGLQLCFIRIVAAGYLHLLTYSGCCSESASVLYSVMDLTLSILRKKGKEFICILRCLKIFGE